MKKTLLTILLMGLVCFSGAAMLSAQVEPLPPETQKSFTEADAQFAKEPPLSQKDIDAYLKFWPKVAKNSNDLAAIEETCKSVGWTQLRSIYVITKIALAQPLIKGAKRSDLEASKAPKSLHPTNAEVELVKKNIKALDKVHENAASQ